MMIGSYFKVLIGSLIGRLGLNSTAVKLNEQALVAATGKFIRKIGVQSSTVTFLALRNLAFLRHEKREAGQCVKDLVGLLERVAAEPSLHQDFSMFMRPTASLPPVLCAFYLLPYQEAEGLFERWAALDKQAHPENFVTKEEIMDNFSDQLVDCSERNLVELKAYLMRRIREAYIGREVRIC